MFDAAADIDLARYIDHSLLDPTAPPERVSALCQEADHFNFASVCVLPCYVKQAVDLLHNSSSKVSTVIGFPLGASAAGVKLYEAMVAKEAGAEELDVVINLGWLKGGGERSRSCRDCGDCGRDGCGDKGDFGDGGADGGGEAAGGRDLCGCWGGVFEDVDGVSGGGQRWRM